MGKASGVLSVCRSVGPSQTPVRGFWERFVMLLLYSHAFRSDLAAEEVSTGQVSLRPLDSCRRGPVSVQT